jgi:IS1 family transposase
LSPSVLAPLRSTCHEESQLSQSALPALEKRGHRSHHSPTVSTRPGGESVVATSARLVGRPSPRQLAHLIIASHHRRTAFDEVPTLSAEGLNKSAIARVKQIAWNTVHRWLERAAAWCYRFNSQKIKRQLQAGEIRTIIGRKDQPIWIFIVIDVWSRLWPSTVVGKRSSRNTLDPFRDMSNRMALERVLLITTDGFKFYERVIGRAFGPACVYGQVIKTRRNDRVVKVERRAVIGAGGLKQVLRNSEDSVKLNTSFVERLNLTIRQGSSYLSRRTISQARWKERLEDHLELLRRHYNFVRRHRALKLGQEVRTPAWQAGLTDRALTLREIFSSRLLFVVSRNVLFELFDSDASVGFHIRGVRLGRLATIDDGSTARQDASHFDEVAF